MNHWKTMTGSEDGPPVCYCHVDQLKPQSESTFPCSAFMEKGAIWEGPQGAGLSTRLLRDRSKDSLGFEGLGQTARGPLKAMALRWEAGGRERLSNLAAREGYL